MDWNRGIDAYCERTEPGLWAEPLNFLSNASFLVAALLAWRLARKVDAGRSEAIMVLLMFAIGLGSGLFHSFASTWAMVADVVPIGLFLLFALGVLLRRNLGCSAPEIALGYVAFFTVTGLCALIPSHWVGGSNLYFGALFALALLALQTRSRSLSAAFALLVLSVTFRSIDEWVCPSFPIGTHFLWHTINGAVLYLVFLASLTSTPTAGRVKALRR